MGSLNVEKIKSLNYDSWNSRHSPTKKPYFQEFLGLLYPEKDGCYGFTGNISLNNYFAATQQEQSETAFWVKCLIGNAKKYEKPALLSFCRSMGRINFLKERFPDATNIVLHRDPFEVFRSNYFQLTEYNNNYFNSSYLLIIAYNHKKIPEFDKYYNQNYFPEVTGKISHDLPHISREKEKGTYKSDYKRAFKDFYLVFFYCMKNIDRNNIINIDFSNFNNDIYRDKITETLADIGIKNFTFKDYKETDIPKSLVDEDELRKLAAEIERDYF